MSAPPQVAGGRLRRWVEVLQALQEGLEDTAQGLRLAALASQSLLSKLCVEGIRRLERDLRHRWGVVDQLRSSSACLLVLPGAWAHDCSFGVCTARIRPEALVDRISTHGFTVPRDAPLQRMSNRCRNVF